MSFAPPVGTGLWEVSFLLTLFSIASAAAAAAATAGLKLDFQVLADPGTMVQLQPRQFIGTYNNVPYTGEN